MQLLITVQRLEEGRLQIIGTVRATPKDVLVTPRLQPLMVRLIPHYFPFLNPVGTFDELAAIPDVISMPTGTPLLIDKRWIPGS